MKTFLKVVLGIFAVLLVLFVAIVGIAIVAVNSQTTKTEVTLGDDSIPTLYTVVGERKVIKTGAGISNGVSYEQLIYDDDVVSNDDISKYISSLKEDEGFLVTENKSTLLQLAKESVDDGKLVLVNIITDGSKVTLEYRKGTGELTIY